MKYDQIKELSEEFNTKTQRHQDTKSGAAIEAHRDPGLLESIYESALCHEHECCK